MSADESENMRGRAYQLCRDYLLGAWKKIDQDSMVMKQISGGLSNHLYYCALPAHTHPATTEPKEVLLRLYGRMHGEDALEHMLAESVIFTLLSERGLGPRLYGVFPGGRLEQYIQARSLFREELQDVDLSRQIATKIAKVHCLNVPISKEAVWLWTSINKWLSSSAEMLKDSQKDKVIINKLRSFDAMHEVEYLTNLVHQLNSPVVFAHNDLQEGNILLQQKTNSNRKVALIDFEYCAYNYRGFDIANHFIERVYGYRRDTAPYFTVHEDQFPTKEEQLVFIRKYLTEFDVAKEENEDFVSSRDSFQNMSPRMKAWYQDAVTVEDKILKEVKVMTLVSHVFWILWSIVQGHVSTITFGYLEYAEARRDMYERSKAALEQEIEDANSRLP